MNFALTRIRRAAALLAFLATAHSASGQQPVDRQSPAGIRLPDKARGEAAIAALANRLPEVAAFHGKSSQRLRELFRKDHSLWVNPKGELFYACEFHGEHEMAPADVIAESIGTTDPAPFDTAEAFLLHSRPGANRVIYLDFDGHADASGSWAAGAESPPFDLDGDETTFSTTERNRIILIWQRVAEDFSMYGIDVTTEDPGVEALRKANSGDSAYGIRVAIGGKSTDWYGAGAGGVAFVGSFDSNKDTPCWVFPKSLGNSEKNIAEAASHEAGHTLGLNHDGITGGATYYGGQGNWAPIMGVSYSKSISQWSKGEYTDANNTQDDLAVMLTQGAVYRADDYGNNIAGATAIPADSNSISIAGVIERNTDVDFISITAAGGTLVINAEPAPSGPNLRLEVKLYDSSGSLLQTGTSADTSAGTQPVTLTRTVTAGTYYISVDGIGNGNPLTTGYSDYASLGQYDLIIAGVLPEGFTWLPVAAGNQQWDNAGNWASNTIPNAAGESLRVGSNIIGDQTIQLASPTTLGSLTLGDSNSSHAFTLAASGGSLVFDNLGSPASLTKTTGGNDAITAPVSLSGELVITQSASGSLSFSGGISGSGALTKAGSGTVVFSTANNYTGATTISSGTLAIGGLDVLGSTSGITLSDGARLRPDVVDAVVNKPITVGATGSNATITAPSINSGSNLFTLGGAISGAGNVTFAGIQTTNAAGTILLNGASTYSGSTFITCSGSTNTRLFLKLGTANALPASTVLTIDGGDGTGSGRVCELDLNGNDQTLAGLTSVVRTSRVHRVVNDSATPATLTINTTGNHTFPEELGRGGGNNFGMTKSGSGTFTLSGSSSYTGATLISGGTLEVIHPSALGDTSGVTIGHGAKFLPNLDGLTIGAPIILGGNGTTATINVPTTGGNTGGLVQTATLNGVISGNGDLTFNGSNGGNTYGTIVLGAANSYSGATRIDCSVNGATCWVRNGTTNALPVTTVLTLDGGPGAGTGRTLRYDLNGFDQTLAGLKNVTGLSLRRQQVDNTGAPATLTVNHADNYTFGGSVGSTDARIQGAISLVKSGVGIFTLVKVHTYTGNTTVNEGILILDDINPSNESSTVTIAATGATLDLDFTGTDTVDKLFIGATQMAAGTYGPGNIVISQLTGTGTLTVTSGPPVVGYSSWASVNGADANFDGDHDNDGVSNGVEYFIGGPDGNTTGVTTLPGVTDTAGTLSVTWTHAADYTGTYGTDYVVETSATLAAPWVTEIAAPNPGSSVTFPTATEVKYTFPIGTNGFVRLKVNGP